MQGTQVSALVGGTKIPHGMQCGQRNQNKQALSPAVTGRTNGEKNSRFTGKFTRFPFDSLLKSDGADIAPVNPGGWTRALHARKLLRGLLNCIVMKKICLTLLLLPFTILKATPPEKFDWIGHQRIIALSAGRYYRSEERRV